MKATAQLRATAYHEAGHAVVALWREAPMPRRVTVVGKGESLGSVTHASWGVRFRPDLELTLSRARRLQACTDALLAGVIAQSHGTGRRLDWAGASSDLHEATRLAGYLNGSSRQLELYLAWRQQCVRDAVEARWSEVERVAQALLSRHTLKGDEVRRIVRELPLEGSWTGVPDIA